MATFSPSKGQSVDDIKKIVKQVAEGKGRRKKTPIAAAAVIVLLLVLLLLLITFPPAPMDKCKNRIQDSGEQGIDCGGTCFRQCLNPEERISLEFLSPASVTDVAVDSLDRIYIVDSARHRLLVYDKRLNYLRNIGEKDFKSGGSGDYEFKNPRAVAISPDRVYVSDRFNWRIQVFDSMLNYVETIGEKRYNIEGQFPGLAAFEGKLAAVNGKMSSIYLLEPGKLESVQGIGSGLDKPEGIAFFGDKLYVADTGNHKVKVFDLQGNKLQEIGGLGNIETTFNYPTGIAARGNTVAVADQANNRVQVFDLGLNYIGALPKPGEQSVEFNSPTKVAIDSADRFIVADTGNNRIIVFDSQFNFVGSLQGISMGEYATGEFSPRYIKISSDGKLFVSEDARNQVTILDSSGGYLGKIGGKEGSGNDEFNLPRDMAVGSDGRLYVADTQNNRVQVFDSKGKYAATIGGKRGTGNYEFDSPRSVALDNQGRVFVVDKENERVQVFDSSFNYLVTIKSTSEFKFDQPIPTAVDSSDNIYVANSAGSSLGGGKSGEAKILVFNSGLSFVKEIDAGSDIIEMEGGIAIDSKDRLLVVGIESYNVKMIDIATGNTVKTIGKYGKQGNYAFDWPHGLAIAPNGDIFVADFGNKRIQVYNSELEYKRTIDGGEDGLIETLE